MPPGWVPFACHLPMCSAPAVLVATASSVRGRKRLRHRNWPGSRLMDHSRCATYACFSVVFLVMVGTAACSVGIAGPPVNKAIEKEAG